MGQRFGAHDLVMLTAPVVILPGEQSKLLQMYPNINFIKEEVGVLE